MRSPRPVSSLDAFQPTISLQIHPSTPSLLLESMEYYHTRVNRNSILDPILLRTLQRARKEWEESLEMQIPIQFEF